MQTENWLLLKGFVLCYWHLIYRISKPFSDYIWNLKYIASYLVFLGDFFINSKTVWLMKGRPVVTCTYFLIHFASMSYESYILLLFNISATWNCFLNFWDLNIFWENWWIWWEHWKLVTGERGCFVALGRWYIWSVNISQCIF